ncbi:transposon ty3-g Gag-Pol polyprotein [Plakobranchus ocellatus]|uniref:Transposon ty3-g Gag-Pol polyprotein n=1 Tax=Plakobranchus ocellatus TaxID=259542 RepID=A0AAV4B939_9GAST|nr:transposon ty3-g Gag-Pol polyprotein [Plakobranchus ocellatus]
MLKNLQRLLIRFGKRVVQHITPGAHDPPPTTVEAVTKPKIQSQRCLGPRAQPTVCFTTKNSAPMHATVKLGVNFLPYCPSLRETIIPVARRGTCWHPTPTKHAIRGESYIRTLLLGRHGSRDICMPASVQDRRAQQPTTALTAAHGTSSHTWGIRSISLAIGHGGQYNHEFYLANVTRPILGADFFTKHRLTIDLRGKRLLSLDNISIILRETKAPLILTGLGFPLPNEISSLLQVPKLLTPHFHHSTNKHDVEHHIVTHGPPTHARARRLDLEKLSAAKSEFLQMEEMGIVRRSKSAWSLPLHIVPKSDGKW